MHLIIFKVSVSHIPSDLVISIQQKYINLVILQFIHKIKLRRCVNFSTIIHHGHRHVAPSHGLIDVGMEVHCGLGGASRINLT
jgi:hypothetical protein